MVAASRSKRKRLNLMERLERPEYFGYSIYRLKRELGIYDAEATNDGQSPEQQAEAAEARLQANELEEREARKQDWIRRRKLEGGYRVKEGQGVRSAPAAKGRVSGH